MSTQSRIVFLEAEVKRLQAERDGYRDALGKIAKYEHASLWVVSVAIAALEAKHDL